MRKTLGFSINLDLTPPVGRAKQKACKVCLPRLFFDMSSERMTAYDFCNAKN